METGISIEDTKFRWWFGMINSSDVEDLGGMIEGEDWWNPKYLDETRVAKPLVAWQLNNGF